MSYSEDEKVAHGEHGVVLDDECLLRIVYMPEHIKAGTIQPSAIPSKDLESRGFSVDRKGYIVLDELSSRILLQTSRVPELRVEHEIIGIKCSEVRAQKGSSDQQAFFVIDSPIPENPAHASIFGNETSKSRIKQIRNCLLRLLQDEYDKGNPCSKSLF